MTEYVRAREIVRKPVVTMAGDDVAQVKDIVFDTARGSVRCFTLSGRGLLAGPLRRALLWEKVHALGPDAVMISDDRAIEDDDRAARDTASGGGGDVLGARVMTDDGTDLGMITDAVIATGTEPLVVGYEVESTTEARRRVLLPVLRPVSISGEMVVVPGATAEFAAGDLAGFPEAAHGLRTRLDEQEA
jgi:uncharacterized protein YrrD